MIARKYSSLMAMAIGLLSITLSSCSNESDETDTGSKFVRITEYPQASGEVENFHADLVYNSLGNVTGYNEASSPGTPVFNLNFTYDGTGTKPVKATYDVSQHFFKYDAAGRLAQDSVIVYDPTPTVPTSYTEIRNITYPSPTLMILNTVTMGTPGINNQIIDSLAVDSRGNVTQSKLYTKNAAGDFYLAVLQNWQYDDKPNPFGSLNIFPVLQPGFTDIYFGIRNRSFLQKNNCTAYSLLTYKDGALIYTESYSFTLSYNSNGTVREAIAVKTAGAGFSYRYVYDYD